MKQNAFGQEIPGIPEAIQNPVVKAYILRTLTSVIKNLGIESPNVLAQQVLEIAESSNTIESYEKTTHALLESKGVTADKVAETLSGRADLIYTQIKKYCTGKTVLDLGCGDGKVGEILARSEKTVTLADVYKHPYVDETGLEFILFDQGEEIPTKKKFDTTLVLTVLHHSSNPLQTLRDAKRLTKKGGKIIVLESVYGIGKDQNANNYGKCSTEMADDFKSLNTEDQRFANVFFDHFYNRVIHYSEDAKNKVNVPFNFRQPERKDSWTELFEKEGLNQIALDYLGIDQPSVPEYHTLHVLEVKND
ncbi:MAG: class I SAM-dependent methyltransferase [Candidatus Woesearchaeota archaeon]